MKIPSRKSKYSNNTSFVRTQGDDNRSCEIAFASKKEANRYKELLLLQRVKKITDLQIQPIFELQESFKLHGKTYKNIKYIADFQYYDFDRKSIVVEDVKGFKVSIYNLKKKLFLKKYGEKYIFMEV